MKRTIVSILLILACNISVGLANSDSIQETLDRLKSALNQHDFEVLAPYLAPDFSFSGHSGDMGRMIMRQIVAQYPKTIEAILIQKVENAEGRWLVSAAFKFQDETVEKELILSDDFKLIQAPIVQIQMDSQSGSHAAKQTATTPLPEGLPAKIIAPFELVGRLIAVTAEIEGIKGKFLVDSGSLNFVVNTKRLPGLMNKAQPMENPVYGAGGAIGNMKLVEASGFKWVNIELPSTKALYYDLSHLEANTGTELLGLIGAEFLWNFAVQFDYARKELTLFSGDSLDDWQTAPCDTLAFEMIGHIPVIQVQIGHDSLHFGIDSGAGGAMLFTKWESRMASHYEVIGQDRLRGGDTNWQSGKVVKLDEFKAGAVSYVNHTFIIADLNWGHDAMIDGLLGYEFLSQYQTMIDSRNRKLYIRATTGSPSK